MDGILVTKSGGPILPYSGPVALSLAEMREFLSLGEANPDDGRYRWRTNRPLAELEDNPCHEDADPVLMLYYADGRPVAGLEAVRDRILVDDQCHEWMWIGNQLTLSDYRGRGLMTSLFDMIKEIGDRRGISIGGAGTTPAGRASYLRNGFKFLGYAPRQSLLLRADNLVRAYLDFNPLATVGSRIANALVYTHGKVLQISLLAGSSDYRWQPADEFDIDVSPLFHSDPRCPRFMRDHEKMKWRWNRSKTRRAPPSRDYRLGFLKSSMDDELAGYLMLRLAEMDRPGGIPVDRLRVVTVLDWGARYQDRQAHRALVAQAVRTAIDMKGDVLEFSTTDRELQTILRHRGFVRLGGYRMFFYGARGTPFVDKDPDHFSHWWWNGCDPEDAFTW